ncbi:non-ribosomal peptide synthetase [Pseudoalteromonas sp. NBT06-2]|uniref:non-ribosomal peptide synthetase n=1 Tax=Pseudoalteromonas sp. NBT06-2 TaxID=2025950 RepID=UPI0014833AAA|nr:non-ribosomal peptide synthetase [Pseudoalteromonas sp. NBT06-2]
MIANVNTSHASLIERQFWLLGQQGKNSAYNVNSIFLFENLDFTQFIASVNAVINTVEILRSSYEMIDGEIVRFDKFNQCTVIKRTFNDNFYEAINWVNQSCNQDFDLANEPLVKVITAKFNDSENLIIAISIHHIVIDLSSKDKIAKLISNAYNNSGKLTVSTRDNEIFNNYQSFSNNQSKWLLSPKGIKSANYWRGKLNNSSTIKLDTPRAKNYEHNSKGRSIEIALPKEIWQDLKKISQKNIISSYVILLTSYYLLLAKYSGESNFCIAVPLSNRKNSIFRNTIGCLVNTVPICVEFVDKDSVFDVLKKVRVALLEAHRHQEYPSIEIINDNLKKMGNKKLYRHGFTFEHPMKLDLKGVQGEVLYYEPLNSQLDLFLRLWEDEEQLYGYIEYDSSIFDNISAQRFRDSFKVLLTNLISNTDIAVSSLDYVREKDSTDIAKFNNTSVYFEDRLNLKLLFERQVENTPNNIALIYKDKRYTYREFNSEVNKLSHYLNNKGVKKGDVVAVVCERSISMMTAIYSILKLGAVYVPIDGELPKNRIDYMLSQSRVKAILTHSNIQFHFNKSAYDIFVLDHLECEITAFPNNNPEVEISSNDLAYIIFTSGSTGKPKGVMNLHSGIANVMLWMKADFKPVKGDVVLQKTPYSFDISLFEIYWPLLVGATVALAIPGSHKDVHQIQKQISQYQVTILHLVPSILNTFILAKPLKENSLCKVVCCGEELLSHSVNSFFKSYTSTELINIYGPTEAAIAVSCFRCNKNEKYKFVPIGKPISNTVIHILDKNLNQSPIGVVGELFIEGVQVAEGYVGNDILTQQQFFARSSSQDSLYKTGDLARWTNDGELEFLGRKDSQVKLSGLRIELSEIETIMHQYTNIQQSVAVIEKKPNGSMFIGILYTVENDQKEINESRLKNYLSKYLPIYMLPVFYMKLAKFPLTSSGKINRNQLPKIVLSQVKSFKKNKIKLTQIQQTVMDAWKTVLQHDNLSIEAHFFEVGGDSMSLMQVLNILDKVFPNRLKSVDLFRFVTIKSIACFLDIDGNRKITDVKETRANKIRSAMKRNIKPRKRHKECDV